MSLKDSQQPQRFAVLSTARTGSNLLMSLLNSYDGIKMYGELFNLDSIAPDKLPEIIDGPVSFLQNKLSRSSTSNDKAIGFKMFYDHMTFDYFNKRVSMESISPKLFAKYQQFDLDLRNSYTLSELNLKFNSVWKHLLDDKTLKIIHLKRWNKLETLISLKTAYITSEWMHWMPKAAEKKTTIHLGVDECFNYFEAIRKYELQSEAAFKEHHTLELYYDNLVNDKQECVNSICDFFGLPEKPVKTLLKKQISFRPDEIIENFDELKTAFKLTDYEGYFSEIHENSCGC